MIKLYISYTPCSKVQKDEQGNVGLQFCNNFWKFGCQPWKSKADLCMTNSSKVLVYLSSLEPFVIQRSALLFRGWQPNSQKWSQHFEVATSKLNIDHPLTSMPSKTAQQNISKIASNECICSKDW